MLAVHPVIARRCTAAPMRQSNRPGGRSIGKSATVIGRKRAAVSETVITIMTAADPAMDISSIASCPGRAKIVTVDRSAAHKGNWLPLASAPNPR